MRRTPGGLRESGNGASLECFGLAVGYQLVGEVMAHQGDDGLPSFIVGSQRQSISPASAGNDRGSGDGV